jgi:hypothetical protein
MKRYIKPSTDICVVELQQMIADSFNQFTDPVDDTEARSKGHNFLDNEGYDDADFTSHSFNVWED